jgi:hypothetical protein
MALKTAGLQHRSAGFLFRRGHYRDCKPAESPGRHDPADATKCRGIVYVQAEGEDLSVIPQQA